MRSPWTLCVGADSRGDKHPLGTKVGSGGNVFCAAGQKPNATMSFDFSLIILMSKTR